MWEPYIYWRRVLWKSLAERAKWGGCFIAFPWLKGGMEQACILPPTLSKKTEGGLFAVFQLWCRVCASCDSKVIVVIAVTTKLMRTTLILFTESCASNGTIHHFLLKQEQVLISTQQWVQCERAISKVPKKKNHCQSSLSQKNSF